MHNVSWKYWKAEVKAPAPIDNRHNDRPADPLLMTGFWRIMAPKTKVDWPVCIWTEADEAKNPTGATIFQIGANKMDTINNPEEWQGFVEKSWLKCEAAPRADYIAALDTGWWGEPVKGKKARKMEIEEELGIEVPKPGDNNAPISELYAEKIKALADKMDGTEIVDMDSANYWTGMDDVMRKLLQLADVEFEREKQPWLDGGRKVDGTWRDVRLPGVEARKGSSRRDAFLRKEQARQQAIVDEENRKRADAAREAEAAARAAVVKEAQQHGLEADEADIAARVAEVVPPVEEVVAPKVRASSGSGRAVSVKKEPYAPIVDIVALVQHLINTGDRLFIEQMQERAKKAQKAKINLPGVEFYADKADWLVEKAKREAAKPGVPAEFEEPKSNG